MENSTTSGSSVNVEIDQDMFDFNDDECDDVTVFDEDSETLVTDSIDVVTNNYVNYDDYEQSINMDDNLLPVLNTNDITYSSSSANNVPTNVINYSSSSYAISNNENITTSEMNLGPLTAVVNNATSTPANTGSDFSMSDLYK
jgi:hypothetical protein